MLTFFFFGHQNVKMWIFLERLTLGKVISECSVRIQNCFVFKW